MYILIPAYMPDAQLLQLVQALKQVRPSWQIVVVDDGSGTDCAPVFSAVAAAGCTVLTHPVNLGKGEALKTGFKHILTLSGENPGRATAAVVTADADGQHEVNDILRVATETRDGDSEIVLGGRSFGADTPLKSRIGNAVARGVFGFATQMRLSDTQTGLRGFKHSTLEWLLQLSGSRYEYEQNQLLYAGRQGYRIKEIPITTVYENNNSGSHFRPVLDSLRVLTPVLLFSSSSLIGFLVDTVTLHICYAAFGILAPSVVLARVVSGVTNFSLNRVIFGKHRQRSELGGQAKRYIALAIALLAANWLLLELLVTLLGLPLLPAKIAVEVVLFLASYAAQRRFVFQNRPASAPAPRSREALSQLQN